MPWIVATKVGFVCLFCAHATSVKPGKNWALDTAAPSRKKGEAQQHSQNGKHLTQFSILFPYVKCTPGCMLQMLECNARGVLRMSQMGHGYLRNNHPLTFWVWVRASDAV